jgi:hypothetical protein
LGKERFQYWQLLLWTLIRKPRLVPVAITLAIYGHHYRMICEHTIFNRKHSITASHVDAQ